jgi:hypothetical protein
MTIDEELEALSKRIQALSNSPIVRLTSSNSKAMLKKARVEMKMRHRYISSDEELR